MTKICRNCGEELEDDTRFCKKCGQSVSYYTDQPEHVQQTYQPVEDKSYTSRLIIGVIASALMPLLGYIMAIYLYTRDSQQAKNYGKIVLIAAIFFTVIWYFINSM